MCSGLKKVRFERQIVVGSSNLRGSRNTASIMASNQLGCVKPKRVTQHVKEADSDDVSLKKLKVFTLKSGKISVKSV